MFGGLELSLIFVFFLFKYAIPEAVASVTGKPTARARDKALRQEAATKAMHERRLANLPPPPPPLGEAIKARLVSWIAPAAEPKPPKPSKPPREKGPWRRAWDSLRKDAGEQAEQFATQVRFDRKNKQRRRNGQQPIVIDVYPCLGCSGQRVVDHPGRLCPVCTRAEAKRTADAAAAAAAAAQRTERDQPDEEYSAPRYPCARGCDGGTVWAPDMVCIRCSSIDEPGDRDADDAGSARLVLPAWARENP